MAYADANAASALGSGLRNLGQTLTALALANREKQRAEQESAAQAAYREATLGLQRDRLDQDAEQFSTQQENLMTREGFVRDRPDAGSLALPEVSTETPDLFAGQGIGLQPDRSVAGSQSGPNAGSALLTALAPPPIPTTPDASGGYRYDPSRDPQAIAAQQARGFDERMAQERRDFEAEQAALSRATQRDVAAMYSAPRSSRSTATPEEPWDKAEFIAEGLLKINENSMYALLPEEREAAVRELFADARRIEQALRAQAPGAPPAPTGPLPDFTSGPTMFGGTNLTPGLPEAKPAISQAEAQALQQRGFSPEQIQARYRVQ